MKKEILKEAIKAVLLDEWRHNGMADDQSLNKFDNEAVWIKVTNNGEKVYYCNYKKGLYLDDLLKKFKPIENKCLINMISKNGDEFKDVKTITDILKLDKKTQPSVCSRSMFFYETNIKGEKSVVAFHIQRIINGNIYTSFERYFKENGNVESVFISDNFFDKHYKKFIKF